MLDIVRSPQVNYERDLQFRLNRLNNLRFNPTLPSPHWREQLSEVARLTVVEGKFLEGSRQAIAARAADAQQRSADSDLDILRTDAGQIDFNDPAIVSSVDVGGRAPQTSRRPALTRALAQSKVTLKRFA